MYESLKQPKRATNFAAGCLDNLDQFITLANQETFPTLEFGLLIKQLEELLHPIILISICAEAFQKCGPEGEITDEELSEIGSKYSSLYTNLVEHQIHNAHEIKPLMSGKDLMKLYKIKGGPKIKSLTEEVFKWQIVNPNSDLESLTEYLEANKEKFLSE